MSEKVITPSAKQYKNVIPWGPTSSNSNSMLSKCMYALDMKSITPTMYRKKNIPSVKTSHPNIEIQQPKERMITPTDEHKFENSVNKRMRCDEQQPERKKKQKKGSCVF